MMENGYTIYILWYNNGVCNLSLFKNKIGWMLWRNLDDEVEYVMPNRNLD